MARYGPPPRARGAPSQRRRANKPADHPRERGEHAPGDVRPASVVGPPPRARGAPLRADEPGYPRRTTPASAGSTSQSTRRPRPAGDHPRERGEHQAYYLSGPCQLGPPPRARGARGHRGLLRVGPRTTPASAGSTTPRRRARRGRRDHPRERGEHLGNVVAGDGVRGPPPRARGALVARRRARVDHRTTPRARGALAGVRQRPVVGGTTPASAGSTGTRCSRRSSPRDHPRERGEHTGSASCDWRCSGPPPRARGAPGGVATGALPGRTTPASAGSTDPRGIVEPLEGDHPRERGEHAEHVGGIMPGIGPPPRARGAHRRHISRHAGPGTTPASAGSTDLRPPDAGTAGDHPRERGEHQGPALVDGCRSGPPPRARGARTARHPRAAGRGTTPASAGSTSTSSAPSDPSWDHPRERGEHLRGDDWLSRLPGPPPRARGAPRQPRSLAPPRRTTPASAGSTRSSSTATGTRRDHPRERGEHGGVDLGGEVSGGPPPRARGARRRGPRPTPATRTTPASAGSTHTSASA